MTPFERPRMKWRLWLVGLAALGAVGCTNAVKTTPHDPVGTTELKPSVPDKDAGLVAMAPGFDLNLSEAPLNPGPEKALHLTGVITRLAPGSRALRFFVGYGVGRAKVQVEIHFIDLQSGQVVMVTADRRATARGLFGGSSEGHLRESLEEMAQDLSRFLQRLAKGQVRLRPTS